MPRPASSVGDRPPTNPAIRVRFPSEVDGFFFRGGKYMRAIDQFELLSSAKKWKAPSTRKIKKRSLHSLSLYEKERSLQIGSMERGL